MEMEFVKGVKPIEEQNKENKGQHMFTTLIANEPDAEWDRFRAGWIDWALNTPTEKTDKTEILDKKIGDQNKLNRDIARKVTIEALRQMGKNRAGKEIDTI